MLTEITSYFADLDLFPIVPVPTVLLFLLVEAAGTHVKTVGIGRTLDENCISYGLYFMLCIYFDHIPDKYIYVKSENDCFIYPLVLEGRRNYFIKLSYLHLCYELNYFGTYIYIYIYVYQSIS